MTQQEIILRAKLSDYYKTIFEEELLNEIISCGILKSINANKNLIEIGDEMTHIPLILKGVVKIVREDENGNEILLYFLEKGDSCAISFINCINLSKSIFSGIVENDTEAIFIPIKKVEEWLIKYKSWRRFILDSYHLRLLEMVESIENLAFKKLDDRLLKYLQGRVKLIKSDTLKITHKEIAADLNTSRVVISRLLKVLENENKIRIARNRIYINSL